MDRLPDGSIVFFPCRQAMLCCGIAGIVAFKNKPREQHPFNFESFEKTEAFEILYRNGKVIQQTVDNPKINPKEIKTLFDTIIEYQAAFDEPRQD